jgi:hypothetical protein
MQIPFGNDKQGNEYGRSLRVGSDMAAIQGLSTALCSGLDDHRGCGAWPITVFGVRFDRGQYCGDVGIERTVRRGSIRYNQEAATLHMLYP